MIEQDITPRRPGARTALTMALLLAGGFAAPAQAAPARGVAKFNGTWSVEVITERGSCDKAYRYGIVIENGQVRYAGGSDFTVSGRVQPNGGVRGSISRGSARADVVGRLADSDGSGTWSIAGERSCGGRWNAERRS